MGKIMAHLTDLEQASMVLRDLPENLQADVVYRMAALESIPPGVIAEMDEVPSEEMKSASHLISKRSYPFRDSNSFTFLLKRIPVLLPIYLKDEAKFYACLLSHLPLFVLPRAFIPHNY